MSDINRLAKVEREVASLRKAVQRLEANTPRKQPQAAISEEAHPGDQSQSASVPGSIVGTPPNPNKSKKGTQQRPKWWKPTFGEVKWKSKLESIGIVFGIGYAIVTYLQWKDAHKYFVADQRAWLYAGAPDLTPREEVTGLSFPIRNSGKTPAQNIQNYFMGNFQKFPPQFNAEGTVPYPMGFISPSAEVKFYYHDAAGQNKKVNFEAAVAHGYAWVVYGAITYEDVSQAKHWTSYCFFAKSADTYYTCPTHNEEGDGPLPKEVMVY